MIVIDLRSWSQQGHPKHTADRTVRLNLPHNARC